tara:strand:+ start:229 stop:462 length:234 start_codon:yes stop_codon:yes gene_type:complete
MKQTAVEWLVNHWKKLQSEGEKMSWNQIIEITQLAKAMEKEQIIDAYGDEQSHLQDDGSWRTVTSEQYYNETYGGQH